MPEWLHTDYYKLHLTFKKKKPTTHTLRSASLGEDRLIQYFCFFQLTCRTDAPCYAPSAMANVTEWTSYNDHRACPLPQYAVISCTLGYLAVALFLTLPILIKTALVCVMAIIFIMLIELSHIQLFSCYDTIVQ